MSRWYLLLILSVYAIEYVISSNITEFILTTKAPGFGIGLGSVTMGLFWNDNYYECKFEVSTPDDYVCNATDLSWYTEPISTPNEYVPYYFKISHEPTNDNFAVRFDAITIIDGDGTTTYTITDFCIPSGMQCSFDTEMGTMAGPPCGQFDAKDTYSELAIGGLTQFTMFYIDLRSRIEEYPNSEQEGGVRPPLLTQIGFITSTQQTPQTDTYEISASWDNGHYQCEIIIASGETNTTYLCNVADPVICPGDNSTFWVSIYHEGDVFAGGFLGVERVFVADETDTRYYFERFCQESNDFISSFPDCSAGGEFPTYKDMQAGNGAVDWLRIGGQTGFAALEESFLMALIAPNCIFNHPNQYTNSLELAVLSVGGIYPIGDFGWGPNLYGGPSTSEAAMCAPTPIPTREPTYEPTADPTNEPTTDPTNDPTIDPTLDPTNDPTDNPTTAIPTISETSPAPSPEPSKKPSPSPSDYPSKAPTTPEEESLDVTSNTVFWGVIALVIFALCCICCFLLIWWRRKKKKSEEEQNKAEQEVAAAAPATAAAAAYHHEQQATYNDYDIGAINTQPSLVEDDDDHFGGQYEAKQEIELQEADNNEEVDKQYTLDGVGGTGTGGNKGDDAVLDILADGHDTGNAAPSQEAQIDAQETFAEYNV